jgi:uncharacterized protein (TIRG00374 family)
VRRFLIATLLLGTLLLGVVVARTDLGEVWRRLLQLGPAAIAAIFLAFFVGHVSLAGSWLLTLPRTLRGPRWLYRIWRVLMVGSAVEGITPFAALGGEPIKAILLKRHYRIAYTDASASLVLTRMTDIVAQIIFIAIGLGMMFYDGVLPLAYRIGSGVGLLLFTVLIVLFFLVQTKRGFSRVRAWLERGWLGDRLGPQAIRVLDAVHEVEDQLVAFYGSERLRFTLSVAFAYGEWIGNTVAVYLAVNALGFPIGFGDALVIEAFLALVRTTLFFVPADIGTQEAAQVLICGAITGSPEAGLALATIRRSRDILWILWGLAIGGLYSLQGAAQVVQAAETPAAEGVGYADASTERRSSRLSR